MVTALHEPVDTMIICAKVQWQGRVAHQDGRTTPLMSYVFWLPRKYEHRVGTGLGIAYPHRPFLRVADCQSVEHQTLAKHLSTTKDGIYAYGRKSADDGAQLHKPFVGGSKDSNYEYLAQTVLICPYIETQSPHDYWYLDPLGLSLRPMMLDCSCSFRAVKGPSQHGSAQLPKSATDMTGTT